jgi:hypothetical protein
MSIVDRMKEAALQREREWQATREHLKEIVIGEYTKTEYLGEVVRVDPESFVVEVCNRDRGSLWTAIYRDRRDYQYFYSVDMALLQLVGLRHGDGGAAAYAARVLHVPTDE